MTKGGFTSGRCQAESHCSNRALAANSSAKSRPTVTQTARVRTTSELSTHCVESHSLPTKDTRLTSGSPVQAVGPRAVVTPPDECSGLRRLVCTIVLGWRCVIVGSKRKRASEQSPRVSTRPTERQRRALVSARIQMGHESHVSLRHPRA